MKKILAAVAAAILAAGAVYYVRTSKDAKTPRYKTAAVENGTIVETVTATGTINAVTTVQVGSQVSGTIERIFVDFNSRVVKGQVIAQIDPKLLEASVVQSRANLVAAQAALDRAKIVAADAQRTLRRQKELVVDGFVSQSDVDAAQTAYDTAVAQQAAAEAQVAQSRGALSAAETNLRYTTIHSPVNGVVVSRNVDVGQTVAASFQTPTLFTIAQDMTKMEVDANVDEADIGRVREGLLSTFTVDSYPEKTFSGRVTQVRNAPIVTQNVVTYNVVIQVDNKELLLKPGMTANVSVQIQKVDGAVKLPNAALRFHPSTVAKDADRKARRDREPGGRKVYILGADGSPAPVVIRTGITDGSFTQVTEGSLKPGDLAVTEDTRPKTSGNDAGGGSPPGMGGRRGGF